MQIVMRYVISDIHGEYGLFMRLMDKIKFSGGDMLYVCGDMVDKGAESVRLLTCILNLQNARCILGNHEYAFLNYYWSLMKGSPTDFDGVLKMLGDWFSPGDSYPLGWDVVDKLEALPFFIEEEQFICAHAGLATDSNGKLLPPQSVNVRYLLENRNFMRPEVLPKGGKCVFFGHTPSQYVCGESRIIAYKRSGCAGGTISDYCKVHLDTGVYLGGVLGCFCIDDCTKHYVSKTPVRFVVQ